MNKYFFSFFIVLISFASSKAQELNCQVSINIGPRVQTTERRIFKDMEVAFSQFMNENRWTNDVFKNEEKINCKLIITIEDMISMSSFKATAQVQSARPVYNTSYETLLFYFFADKDWQFEYVESQPLVFNQNTFTTNLTSMLAYYANIIIGMDYDSFKKLGGSPYFERALTIVNNAQQADRPGWKQFDGNINRYWLSENLNSQQMLPFREGIYSYHRLALDNFAEDPDNSRKIVLDVLKNIQKVNSQRQNTVLVRAFFDAKINELVSIFSKGDPQVKQSAYAILTEIDPTQSDKYQTILKSN